jgi:DNA polymerase elongation subunit (family B)
MDGTSALDVDFVDDREDMDDVVAGMNQTTPDDLPEGSVSPPREMASANSNKRLHDPAPVLDPTPMIITASAISKYAAGNPPGQLAQLLSEVRRVNPREAGITGDEDRIVFQMDEIGYVTSGTKPEIPPFPGGSGATERPVIHLTGCTDTGMSVLVRVYGFEPYMYCDCDAAALVAHAGDKEKWMAHVARELNAQAWKATELERANQLRSTKGRYAKRRKFAQEDDEMDMDDDSQLPPDLNTIEGPIVVRIEHVRKMPIRGYHWAPVDMFRIVSRLPNHIKVLRQVIEDRVGIDSMWVPGATKHPIGVYEANVAFEIRFMTDMNIVGSGWVALDLKHTHPTYTDAHFASRVRYNTRDALHMADEAPWHETCAQLGRTYESRARKTAVSSTIRGTVDEDAANFSTTEVFAKRDYVPRTDPCADGASRCQIEADIWYEDVVSLGAAGEWSKHANLRVLSVDSEEASRNGDFVNADVDPVVCICSRCTFETPKYDNTVDRGTRSTEQHDIDIVFQLKSCDNIPKPGVRVVWFDDERSMIMAFRDLIVQHDPDFIIGHNAHNFDIPYVIKRATVLGIGHRFCDFSRIRGDLVVARDSGFQSRGTGRLENKSIKMTGRLLYDLLMVAQRSIKLPTYTLNSIAGTIGLQKIEMDHHELPKLFFHGTSADRARIALYCMNDAALPLAVMRTRCMIINGTEMARATCTPMSYELSRGQQARVQAQLLPMARNNNYVVNFDSAEDKDSMASGVHYEGATVLDPQRGIFYETITTLDFNSLYPSIMRAHNMDYSTILEPEQLSQFHTKNVWKSPSGVLFVCAPQQFTAAALVKLGITPGDEFLRTPAGTFSLRGGIKVSLDLVKSLKLSEGSDYIIDTPTVAGAPATVTTDSQKHHGVLPLILMGLIHHRGEAKKLMAAAEPAMKPVFDGRQLAMKLVANSVYGFTGVDHGILPEKRIAASVTSRGRELIDLTKATVEEVYSKANGHPSNADVIYGDSVLGNTPIIVRSRRSGAVHLVRIDELPEFISAERNVLALLGPNSPSTSSTLQSRVAGMWQPYGNGKEAIECSEFEVWSDHEFTSIQHIIRHRCAKTILRVCTDGQGFVDCTEDHSLVLADTHRTPVRPADVAVGTRLLTVGDGRLFVAVAKGTQINPITDVALAHQYGLYLNDSRCSAVAFPTMVRKFRNSAGEAKVPDRILFAPRPILKAFWEGYHNQSLTADPTALVCTHVYNFTVVGKQLAAGLWLVATQLGMFIRIDPSSTLMNQYIITASMHSHTVLQPHPSVQRIQEIYHPDTTVLPDRCMSVPIVGNQFLSPTICPSVAYSSPASPSMSPSPLLRPPELHLDIISPVPPVDTAAPSFVKYVYDLETKCHHFHVAPGTMVVHNTDSVMVRFKPKIPHGREVLTAVAEEATANMMSSLFAECDAAEKMRVARAKQTPQEAERERHSLLLKCANQLQHSWECICAKEARGVPPAPAERDTVKATVVRTISAGMAKFEAITTGQAPFTNTDDGALSMAESIEYAKVCLTVILANTFCPQLPPADILNFQHHYLARDPTSNSPRTAAYNRLSAIIGAEPAVAFGSLHALYTKLVSAVRIALDMIAVTRAAEYGKNACDRVSGMLPPPLRIEFEKTWASFLLFTKKRYAGIKCVWDDKLQKMVMNMIVQAMGLETVRRDGCSMQRRGIATALTDLLVHHDPYLAIANVRKTIADIRCAHIPIDNYVITKALSKKETPFSTKQAHVELAKKLAARKETECRLGDRIRMVIVAKNKKAKTWEKSEDPMYAAINDVHIDEQYYIEKQLQKPIERVFNAVVANPKQIFNPSVPIDEILKLKVVKLPTTFKGDGTITVVEDVAAQQHAHEVTKVRVVAPPVSKTAGSIGNFLVVLGVPCVHCGCNIPTTAKKMAPALCGECIKARKLLLQSNTPESAMTTSQLQLVSISHTIAADIEDCAHKLSNVMLHCSRCIELRLGVKETVISCRNPECTVSYARIYMEKSLATATKMGKRLAVTDMSTK